MELKNNLATKSHICHDALESLHNAIKLLHATDEVSKENEYLAFQDSVIKRFEYSLDVTWKYTKGYLLQKFGVTVKSPKETFRESFKQNLFDAHDAELSLAMIDDRNETSHRYNETKAKEICDIIPTYYEILVRLLKKIS